MCTVAHCAKWWSPRAGRLRKSLLPSTIFAKALAFFFVCPLTLFFKVSTFEAGMMPVQVFFSSARLFLSSCYRTSLPTGVDRKIRFASATSLLFFSLRSLFYACVALMQPEEGAFVLFFSNARCPEWSFLWRFPCVEIPCFGLRIPAQLKKNFPLSAVYIIALIHLYIRMLFPIYVQCCVLVLLSVVYSCF